MHRRHALELYSPLPPAECASRLSDAINHDGFGLIGIQGIHGYKPVDGRFRELAFELRKRNVYRNALQPVLVGTLLPHGAGTVIRGRFRLQHGMSLLMRIAVLITILFAGAGLFLFSLQLFEPRNAKRENAWIALVVSAVPYLLLKLVSAVGRLAAYHETRYLADFLRDVLSAHPAPLPAEINA